MEPRSQEKHTRVTKTTQYPITTPGHDNQDLARSPLLSGEKLFGYAFLGKMVQFCILLVNGYIRQRIHGVGFMSYPPKLSFNDGVTDGGSGEDATTEVH